jgi:hypothetical protein
MSGISPAPTTGGGHEPLRRGWLRNGNTPGDPSTALRCGARTRAGGPCRAPAMANGRCRMHGGASTGPQTAVGRAICGHMHRRHPQWLAATRDYPSTASRAARLTRAMASFSAGWTNPFRRPKALLRLLRSVGRLLPDHPDPWSDFATQEMARYVRPAVDDVLRWLGESTLAPRERPDSQRVLAVLTGAVDACSIGDAVYRNLRRRALRQHAQRHRRATKAAEQGRSVKPTSAAHAKAPHTPRESSPGRTAGPFSSPPAKRGERKGPIAQRWEGQVGRVASRGLCGEITIGMQVKPNFAAGTQEPYAPRGSCPGRSAGILASSSFGSNAAMSRQVRSRLRRDRAGVPAKERGPLAHIMSGRDARGAVKPVFVASMEGPHAPRPAWQLPLARPPPATASSPWAAGVGVC